MSEYMMGLISGGFLTLFFACGGAFLLNKKNEDESVFCSLKRKLTLKK